MLCGLENTKTTSYTEVTLASKNLLLSEFQHQFYIKSRLQNRKFDLVRLSNFFGVSSIWFDCRTQSNEFDLVRLSSIEIQFGWVRLTLPGITVRAA